MNQINLKDYVYNIRSARIGRVIGSVEEYNRNIVYRIHWLDSDLIVDDSGELLRKYVPILPTVDE